MSPVAIAAERFAQSTRPCSGMTMHPVRARPAAAARRRVRAGADAASKAGFVDRVAVQQQVQIQRRAAPQRSLRGHAVSGRSPAFDAAVRRAVRAPAARSPDGCGIDEIGLFGQRPRPACDRAAERTKCVEGKPVQGMQWRVERLATASPRLLPRPMQACMAGFCGWAPGPALRRAARFASCAGFALGDHFVARTLGRRSSCTLVQNASRRAPSAEDPRWRAAAGSRRPPETVFRSATARHVCRGGARSAAGTSRFPWPWSKTDDGPPRSGCSDRRPCPRQWPALRPAAGPARSVDQHRHYGRPEQHANRKAGVTGCLRRRARRCCAGLSISI